MAIKAFKYEEAISINTCTQRLDSSAGSQQIGHKNDLSLIH